EPRLLNGALYSVNPIALSRSLAYLWQNKRRVTVIRNSPVGDYLFLEIGATNVGSIVDTAGKGSPVERGDEKGYFRFGGSMVLLIFPESSIRPADDLSDHSARGIELYAKVGDSAGTLCQ
ncbi:MAG: phosphatidylserine decarboxylase, partial [Verrucomicrobiota bacterium]